MKARRVLHARSLVFQQSEINRSFRFEPGKHLKINEVGKKQNPALNPKTAVLNLRSAPIGVLEPTSSPALPPEPSVPASNAPARSNSPAPAIPHPSAARLDTLTAPRHSLSAPCSPRSGPSCLCRIPPASRQPESSCKSQFEVTFFLSSTKTDVVINLSHVAQPVEILLDGALHIAASLQMPHNNRVTVSVSGVNQCQL